MVSNYCGKDEGKLSLEEMRGEVLAMLKCVLKGKQWRRGTSFASSCPRADPLPLRSARIELSAENKDLL